MKRDMRDPRELGAFLAEAHALEPESLLSRIADIWADEPIENYCDEGPIEKYGDPRTLPPTAGGEVDAG